jgi:Cu(I)/Ag(I) efflux system membrane protein CusA/SilA
MLINVRASMLISGLLPVAVLMCFIAMKNFGIDANIVALSGIAIAIGTMVDMGVVLSENMIRHLDEADVGESKLEVIYRATVEVASAVITAVATTIVSFIPVFTMEAAEGKLFRPLAYTKTFSLLSAIILAIIILPPLAHWLFSIKLPKGTLRKVFNGIAIIAGLALLLVIPWAGLLLITVGVAGFTDWITQYLPTEVRFLGKYLDTILYALVVAWLLTQSWLPLGPSKNLASNYFFVCLLIGLLIILFYLVIYYYPRILRWCLDHKLLFLTLPLVLIITGMLSWIGFQQLFGLDKKTIHQYSFLNTMNETFPGIGKEFMPSLDEGAFLLMPTSMPHSGIEENIDVVQKLDMAVTAIPEVETVVGKLGRVESALDPAPISMYENIINYQSEYKVDEDGNRLRFKVDEEGNYVRDKHGNLIEDKKGKFYRNWRNHIQSPDDIWNEIAKIQLPGVTSAPKLQPIETRLVMLQTGMRAPMGIKVKGPDLKTIEAFGLQLEDALKEVEGVKKEAVFADRIVGKPYLEIDLDRKKLARYGITIQQVQHYIEVAIGGMQLSTTVDGRERYPIRVRYARELRDSPDKIEKILIPATNGTQIPLGEVSTINYVQGPQSIKSEDTF